MKTSSQQSFLIRSFGLHLCLVTAVRFKSGAHASLPVKSYTPFRGLLFRFYPPFQENMGNSPFFTQFMDHVSYKETPFSPWKCRLLELAWAPLLHCKDYLYCTIYPVPAYGSIWVVLWLFSFRSAHSTYP